MCAPMASLHTFRFVPAQTRFSLLRTLISSSPSHIILLSMHIVARQPSPASVFTRGLSKKPLALTWTCSRDITVRARLTHRRHSRSRLFPSTLQQYMPVAGHVVNLTVAHVRAMLRSRREQKPAPNTTRTTLPLRTTRPFPSYQAHRSMWKCKGTSLFVGILGQQKWRSILHVQLRCSWRRRAGPQ